jgi:hypothetical protein
LCGGLNDIVDFLGFWDLFRLNLDEILGVAEFASPKLYRVTILLLVFLILTMHVESSLATFAEDWVPSR